MDMRPTHEGEDLWGVVINAKNDRFIYGCRLKNARINGAINEAYFADTVDVIDMGMTPSGRRFIAVNHDSGMMIRCGCHWFDVRRARKHWAAAAVKERNKLARVLPGDDRVETRAMLECAIVRAKARGWRVFPKPVRKPKAKRKAAKKRGR